MIPEDFWLRAKAMLKDKELIESSFRYLKSYQSPLWTQFWLDKALAPDLTLKDLEKQKYICGCLAIACYPYASTKKQEYCYFLLKNHYSHLCDLEGFPLINSQFSYKGRNIPFILRVGHKAENTLLIIRGLDSSKEVRYWDESVFLKSGFNIVSVDFPGMGENPLHMNNESDNFFSALIDYLSQSSSMKNFVVWGLGFGGYWATKIAMTSSKVIGCINQGGPIKYGFKPNLRKLIWHLSEIKFLSDMIQRAVGGSEPTRSFIRKLPIKQQALASKVTCAYLYINGYKDKTASHKDGDLLKELIDPCLFNSIRVKDGGHLAIDRLDDVVLPQILTWLESLKQHQSMLELKQA